MSFWSKEDLRYINDNRFLIEDKSILKIAESNCKKGFETHQSIRISLALASVEDSIEVKLTLSSSRAPFSSFNEEANLSLALDGFVVVESVFVLDDTDSLVNDFFREISSDLRLPAEVGIKLKQKAKIEDLT